MEVGRGDKDTLLFKYEDPGKVTKMNLGAMIAFPIWTYLSYTSYKLNDYLAAAGSREEQGSRGWVLENVEKSSKGVAVAFFLFGL